MNVAIIGAAGKTGLKLVRASLKRGHRVSAVCRTPSVEKLAGFADNDRCVVFPAPVVSDRGVLGRALAGCDAVVAILISVRRLKATDLVTSLAAATAASGVKRLVFTAGEVTAVPEKDDILTRRHRLMIPLFKFISWFTPFSMTDMIQASVLVRKQPAWEWTIVRAPTLTETPAGGYRVCEIHEVTAKHALSREDYAACLLDAIENPNLFRRTVTVVPAGD